MTADLILPAPAKLNRFLHICGRRADGYHNLQTLFQFLDYSDTLSFHPRTDGVITVTPELPGVPQEHNLIYKAARALQTTTHCTQGADIHLDKRLPMGGGIGGGSSNAATTLLGLRELWQLEITDEALLQIARRLGADVPIFVHGHTAWAEGIGDQLTDVDMDQPWFIVVIPPVHVSTAKVFSHERLTRGSAPIKLAAFLEQGGRNDCEELVKNLYPEVDFALNWLNNLAPSRMTGTGACIFAPCESNARAEEILLQLPATLRGFVAKGVNRSPLHRALEQIRQQ